MRSALIVVLIVAALYPCAAYAQNASVLCAKSRQGAFVRTHAKATIADPAEGDYDVKYVKLNLAMTNTSTAISGDAVTRATVMAASMSSYVFELDPQLTIDSCKVNGVLRAVSSLGFVRSVALPAALGNGASFTAQVWYRGQPLSGSGFNTGGLNTATDLQWRNPVTYTLSEPYAAAGWWPCKMALHDKIDSTDIWITVADTLMAGSNGLLAATTPLPGNRMRYEWKHRSPINYYLPSVSVARYTDYSYYAHYSGSTDSTLVQNYVYAVPGTLAYYKTTLDSVGGAIDYYSQVFGRYPFWKEKYGHCIAPLFGGQEHQTMSTVGYFNTAVLAHELAHQWWGDEVTCASFADIWLNEGFASYCENIFYEHFRSPAAAAADMLAKHKSVMERPGGSVYVADTTDEDLIFDGRLTYNKGASVMHMLRYLAGSDTTFFRMLRTYRAQYANSVAYTFDFKAVAQAAYGMNLDSFFRQWVYGEGYPTYSAAYNQKGNTTVVEISQITSKPVSVAAFSIPVEVLLSGPAGDTIVTVPMSGAASLITFSWSKPIQRITIDPRNWIPNRDGVISQNPSLGIGAGNVISGIGISPNPARSAWTVSGIPAGYSTLVLTDAAGREVSRFDVAGASMIIRSEALAAGIYLLHVRGDKGEEVIKLIRE